MNAKVVMFVVTLIVGVALPGMSEALPPEVQETVNEMRESGASARVGFSKGSGLFVIGVGHSRFRPGAIGRCRELARAEAIKQIAASLSQSVKAKDRSSLIFCADGEGRAKAEAILSSLTEIKVDQMLKGVQVVQSGKNKAGEMEVVACVIARERDQTDELIGLMDQWGDRGVVFATGVDADRAIAERNALRSAVEQVAGTMVVGKVSVTEQEELHKRLATTAGALVEEFRVVKETKVEMDYRVELLARVSKKKLYESYRSYFKCLDDPSFCLTATDKSLVDHFSQFFVEKGMRVVDRPELAQYIIELDGCFVDRPTPGNPSSNGTMLNLNISVAAADGSCVLLSLNETRAKDSSVLTPAQRRQETARLIFEKLEPKLHQALHEMVVRMLDESDLKSTVKVDAAGE